jgi:hypothetical protein
MALKIISFIFGISMASDFANPNQDNNAPFNVNENINRVTVRYSPAPNPPPLNPVLLDSEFPIYTNVFYPSALNNQQYPSVAFDGVNYLVVWEDWRNDSGNQINSDIYGVMINQAGGFLDSTGFAISTAANYQGSPAVAFDGTNYFVVWQDKRNWAFYDIYGTRVSRSGVVLDSEAIAISTAPYGQYYPAVAFDGTNYLVVWQDYRNGAWDIYGARVSPLGIVLDSAGMPISTAGDSQYFPAIAFNDSNYLVVWQGNQSGSWHIYGVRVNSSGVVLDPNPVLISNLQNYGTSPSVASDGTNYMVVWSNGDIYGSRVNQAGIVLDTNGILIVTADLRQLNPAIAFDDTNYLVVWSDRRYYDWPYIYGSRVTQSGIVLGAFIISDWASSDMPSIAFGRENYLVVWYGRQDYAYSNLDIGGRRVDRSGAIVDSQDLIISRMAEKQVSPSVAFDGINYFVVWQDYYNNTASSWDIYGALVSQSGVILHITPISIAADDQVSPKVAFDGTYYLVVWQDHRTSNYSIYGARVNRSGNLIDENGFAISDGANQHYSPSVIFGGYNYLVVWQEMRGGSWDIYGARVNRNAIVLDPDGIAISTAYNSQTLPSVAFDGTNYFVVWEDYRNYNADIYGTWVSTLGNVTNPEGYPISTEIYSQNSPAAAFNGTKYLVVWEDYRSGSEFDIYGVRLDPWGIIDTAATAISTAANDQRNPSVFSNIANSSYFAVWEDKRNGSDFDIYGARISDSGMIIDTFPISVQAGDQISPSLAQGSENQYFFAYSGWTDSIRTIWRRQPVNTMRIWGKLQQFVGIDEQKGKNLTGKFGLRAYPNPFSSFVVISYSPFLTANEMISLKIYDEKGGLVKDLTSSLTKNPNSFITWNGTDDFGRKLSSGIYFCCFKTADLTTTKKIIKAK